LQNFNYKNLKAGYKNINFIHGNILDLSQYKNNFDAAICSRVLINLGTPSDQTLAMKNVYDSLKKNSLFIVNEVEASNHKKLSKLRKANGLEPLERYWHNLYLNEKQFLKNAKKIGFKIIKKIQYGEYQILSKVIYPKIIQPYQPNFMSGFNKFSSEIFLKDKKFAKKLIQLYLNKKLNNIMKASHQTGYVFLKV
jgi:ubiquinone/menaquinone biosynthesis C-methylase UbiE